MVTEKEGSEKRLNLTARARLINEISLPSFSDVRVPAALLHAEVHARHGAAYRTPGYYLKLYRLRANISQVALAKKAKMLQHHLSEMKHNKRPIGKTLAKRLAKILHCEYQELL